MCCMCLAVDSRAGLVFHQECASVFSYNKIRDHVSASTLLACPCHISVTFDLSVAGTFFRAGSLLSAILDALAPPHAFALSDVFSPSVTTPETAPNFSGKAQDETDVRITSPGGTASSGAERSKPPLAGIGIVFKGTEDGGLAIDSLLPAGPAEACGQINAGDRLMSIDGILIDLLSDKEIAKTLLGAPGTTVILGLKSIGGQNVDVSITRQLFQGLNLQRTR
eukprot:CAMPEP_0179441542 /NCGR_PEP_ID=MMETSP0799-20121207/25079_1 /TAXON_ID=46947 /ORGANISM="Geminigera cryophila, Strain CCMP2564" /LENGTH=222 /DNA_ID=CAMNT_0021225871 /DNA_START=208 /DNA_END=876 /DNA_ORIENTATION=+